MSRIFTQPLWRSIILTCIVMFAAFLRLRELDRPADYVFDEVYHVPTIKLIARSDQRAYEWWHQELSDEIQTGTYIDWLHPPLAKLIQASSINIFGDQAWTWRLPSAIAGCLLVLVIYGFTRTIWPSKPAAALLAAFFAAIDGLALAQSRIAMNDIFVTLFMILAVWLYYIFRQKQTARWLFLVGLVTGLAISSKWSGFWLFPFFGFIELFNLQPFSFKKLSASASTLIFIVFSSFFIYLASYWQLFQTHSWDHFISLHQEILQYQTQLDATHPYSSSAWQWPFGWQPVFLYQDTQNGFELWNRPFYPSWYLVLLSSLIGIVLIYFPFFHSKKIQAWSRKLRPASNFLLLAYLCFWLPWIFSPRIMFFHHYLPALPLLWIFGSGVITSLISFLQKNHVIIKKQLLGRM